MTKKAKGTLLNVEHTIRRAPAATITSPFTRKAKESLNEQIDQVRDGFREQFPIHPELVSASDMWVIDVFDDYVVVDAAGTYYKVTYSGEGESMQFAEKADWVEVERETEWVAKSVRAQLLEMGRNPLKSIAATDDELTVANYMVLFGDEEHRDLYEEWFTQETDFDSPYVRSGVLHVDFEHGLGKMLDGGLGPDGDDPLGRVEMKSAKLDEYGLWAERVLDRHNKYVQMLEPLFELGIVGSSTESMPQKALKKPSGEIVAWPLKRDSITFMPAEPRMITDNSLAVNALKFFAPAIPGFNEAEPEAEPKRSAATAKKVNRRKAKTPPTSKAGTKSSREKTAMKLTAAQKKAVAEFAELMGLDVEALSEAQIKHACKSAGVPIVDDEDDDEVVTLSKSALTEIVDSASTKAATAAVKEAMKTAPASNGLPSGTDPEVVLDEADQPFPADEFFIAVKSAALAPADMDPRLKPLRAALGSNTNEPANAGYLVQGEVATGIKEKMFDVGQILSRVATDPIGPNSNSMSYNAVDENSRAAGSRYGGIRGYWTAEAGEIPASTPKFTQIELKLKKVAALCYATDEQLSDASALRSWLTRTVPEELRFQVEDAIIEGNGVGKPLGILNAPALRTVTRTNANAIVAADIGNMWANRWAGGRNYIWLANQEIMPQLMTMTLGDTPIFIPPGGYADRPLGNLLGLPYVEIEYASALGTPGDLMLVDLSQYQAISKGEIESAVSIHVQFVTAQQAFRFIYRIDGAPIWKSALTPFKGTGTRSPFVALSADS